MPADLKRKVGRDSIRTLIASGIVQALVIVTGIVVARALGPAGKGAYSGVQLLQTAIIPISGGIGSAITYYVTRRAQPISALIPALLRVLALLCAMIWLGLAVWALLHGITTIWLVMVSVVPASVILSWQPFLFISLDKIRNLNLQNVGLALVTLISVTLALFLFHAGVVGALLAWVISVYLAASVVVGYAMAAIHNAGASSQLLPMRELVNFGSRASLIGVLSFLNARVDSMLVIAMLGVAGFGIYSMAIGVAGLLYMISGAIGTSMARSMGVTDLKVSSGITAKAVRLNTIIVGLVSLVLFCFAPFVIPKVYGAAFSGATLPVRILLPGLVVFSSSRIFNPFFTYQLGRPLFSAYLLLVVALVQAAGCVLLIPRLGLAGAALASTTAYFMAAFGQTWYFCKVTALNYRQLWLPRRNDIGQLIQSISASAAKP
jgi:O-antigen/teichoic acid export membrane protein